MYNIEVIRENVKNTGTIEKVLFGSVNLYIDVPSVLRMILENNSRTIAGFRIWKVTKQGYTNAHLNLKVPTEIVETTIGINDDFLAAIRDLHERWLDKGW